MQPRLAVPVAVGGQRQRAAQCVNVGIGRFKSQPLSERVIVVPGSLYALKHLPLWQVYHAVDAVNDEVAVVITVLATAVTARQPLEALQTAFTVGRLKHAGLVGTDVAIAVQVGRSYLTHTGFHPHTALEARVAEPPDGSLTVGAGQHLQLQHAPTPSSVGQLVDPAALMIQGPAVVGGVQRDAVHQEAQVAVVAFLHQGKHRAVACLHTPVGVAAVERTGEAVRTVYTGEGIAHGEILLRTPDANLVEVIGC